MYMAPAGYRTLTSFSLAKDGPVLEAKLWYPAHSGAQERSVRYAGVFVGSAATDAAPGHGPARGLCVLAHGLRGTAYDLAWLGERLARAGYVALSFVQPGVSAGTYDPILAPQIWRRAALLGRAIDWASQDAAVAALCAHAPVFVAGHSAGASAAFVLAGAEADAELFGKRYGRSGPLPLPLPPDVRVRAILALAPGTGEVFTDQGLTSMRAPCFIVSSEQDRSCPDAYNAQRFVKQFTKASWFRVAKAGHYVFKPCCTFYGRLRAGGICRDAGGVNRQSVHDAVYQIALDLFGRCGRPAAK